MYSHSLPFLTSFEGPWRVRYFKTLKYVYAQSKTLIYEGILDPCPQLASCPASCICQVHVQCQTLSSIFPHLKTNWTAETIWPWVKNTGYPKKTLFVKRRINKTYGLEGFSFWPIAGLGRKPVVPVWVGIFLTHDHLPGEAGVAPRDEEALQLVHVSSRLRNESDPQRVSKSEAFEKHSIN